MTTKWNKKTIKERVLEYVKVAEKHYKRDFTTDLPEIVINENKSIHRRLGCCGFEKGSNRKFEYIEITRFCIEKYTDELVDKVIGHEVGHYIALSVYNSAYHDDKFKEVCSVLSEIGVKVSGFSVEKDSENYIREGYKENKPKRNTKSYKQKVDEYNKKKDEARYILKCKDCDCMDFYKRAKADSIERWVLRYSCYNRNHKESLVCYDVETGIKYENNKGKIKESAMTKEDYKICERARKKR